VASSVRATIACVGVVASTGIRAQWVVATSCAMVSGRVRAVASTVVGVWEATWWAWVAKASTSEMVTLVGSACGRRASEAGVGVGASQTRVGVRSICVGIRTKTLLLISPRLAAAELLSYL
jgi:hypothetical protein